MADEKAEQAEAKDDTAGGGGGKSKLLLLGGGLGALLLAGALAWWLGLFQGSSGHAAAPAHGEAEKHASPSGGHGGGGLGAMVALDPFIANLNDEDGRRYLKATLQLEFFDGAVPSEFNARLPQLRDLLLTLLSSKTFAEVRTPQGKAVLRDEIVTRLNHALRADLVKAVYFTEFIVQ